MEEKTTESRRRHPAAVPIGGLFVILAVIGLITVITASLRMTERLLDNSKEKEAFAQKILPVLMFDPGPFEDPSELDNQTLLRSSIWSALIENIEKYSINESNSVLMSKGDVDVACAKLFGPDIVLEHQSFTNYASLYYYDGEKETYIVPVDSDAMLYTPQVESISREGDTLSLTVGYMANESDWIQRLKGEKYEPKPDKYMIYQLKKVDKNYQLIALKDPPEGAVPGVPQIQPEENLPIPPQNPAMPPNPDGEPHDHSHPEPTETEDKPQDVV